MIFHEQGVMLSDTVQGDWLFGKSSLLMLDELDDLPGSLCVGLLLLILLDGQRLWFDNLC